MAKRKIEEFTSGNYTVKVYYDPDYSEYVARLYEFGKLYEPADAFDTDKQSIIDTAKSMLNFVVKKTGGKKVTVTGTKNPRKPKKQYYAVKLSAPNSTNGKARRGWLIFFSDGSPVDFVDEGIYGNSALRNKYPDVIELVNISVASPIYAMAKKNLLKPW